MNEQQRKELNELKSKYAPGNIPVSEMPEWFISKLLDRLKTTLEDNEK